MSLETIPYQPLPFDVEENCTLPCSPWIQLIEKDDPTKVQFRFGACGFTPNVIVNGDFSDGLTGWSTIGAWTVGSNTAFSPPAAAGFISQAIVGQTGLYYQVTFNATVNNGNLLVGSDTAIAATFTSSGFKTVIIPATGITSIDWFFDAAAGGSLSNIIVKPLTTRVRIDVVDLDDNIVATVGSTHYTFSAGFLTARILWNTLAVPDGCYKLVAYDPCDCAQFGFVGDDFRVGVPPSDDKSKIIQLTTALNTGSFGNGEMRAVSNDFGGSSTAFRANGLICAGVEYEFTYTVSGLNAGDTFQLRAGAANGVVRTANGTYTETLTSNHTTPGAIAVRWLWEFVGLNVNPATLTNFSMQAVDPIPSYTSVPFQLKNHHPCTVPVSMCSNGNQMNFGFVGTGFAMFMRLEGTWRGSNYPSVREAYEYSNGEKTTYYGRKRKGWSLLTGGPEYVHDYLTNVTMMDNVTVNGIAVFCEDDEYPTPSLEDDMDHAVVTLSFTRKQELTEKTACAAGVQTACGQGGVLLTVPFTGGRPIGGGLTDTVGNKLVTAK
jgi:hypothetical protein